MVMATHKRACCPPGHCCPWAATLPTHKLAAPARRGKSSKKAPGSYLTNRAVPHNSHQTPAQLLPSASAAALARPYAAKPSQGKRRTREQLVHGELVVLVEVKQAAGEVKHLRHGGQGTRTQQHAVLGLVQAAVLAGSIPRGT